GVLDTPQSFACFASLIVCVAASFGAAGLFTAAMLARTPAHVARVYAANLLGSGTGCALAVPLLEQFLPASTVLVFALLACAAPLLLIPSSARRRRASALALLAITLASWAF